VVWAPEKIKPLLLDFKGTSQKNFTFFKKYINPLGIPPVVLKEFLRVIEHEQTSVISIDISRIKFFNAGDEISMGNSEWEVLHTPGHCYSHYSFFQKEFKWFLGGDTLLEIIPFPTLVEDPKNSGQRFKALPAFLRTLEQLSHLNIEQNFPGHGNEFSNVNQLIKRQIERIHQRKKQCFEIIKKQPSSIFDITNLMYKNKNWLLQMAGFFMIFGYTDLLIEEGEICSVKNEKGEIVFQLL